MAIKIDLNKNILGLDGKPLKEGVTLGQVVARVLANTPSRGRNAVKLFAWALRLAAAQPLELDQADQDALVNIVQTSEELTVAVAAQVLEVIRLAAIPAVDAPAVTHIVEVAL